LKEGVAILTRGINFGNTNAILERECEPGKREVLGSAVFL
jgi:hypothetical protein